MYSTSDVKRREIGNVSEQEGIHFTWWQWKVILYESYRPRPKPLNEEETKEVSNGTRGVINMIIGGFNQDWPNEDEASANRHKKHCRSNHDGLPQTNEVQRKTLSTCGKTTHWYWGNHVLPLGSSYFQYVWGRGTIAKQCPSASL